MMGPTVLGVAWDRPRARHLVLVRDYREYGRLAIFTVLIAVFVG